MRAQLLHIIALSLAFAGCGELQAPGAIEGRAPALGKAQSSDSADHSCQIVLRSIGRQPGGSDYQTQCSGKVCSYIWKGTVELADGLAGTVHVLYRQAGDATWWQVAATPAASSQPGFVAYDVALAEHLFGPGAAPKAISLIPYLERPDGSRLFDHNRQAGDLDTYTLDAADSYALGDGGACAPVFGRLSFFDNWGQNQTGALRQGGYLVVDYGIARLAQCRGTHNGYPAWDIVAHARFLPGGQELSGSVRELVTAQGTPTGSAVSKSLTLKIPTDATAVELWFHNYTGAGSSCQAWDSNYGKNYRFDIWPPASDPRCKGIESWTSWASDMPYRTDPTCLGYTVDANVDASYCELYLNGIGDGYMGHYGIPNHWVEAYVTVGPQQGQLLNVGMHTRYVDVATKAKGERVTIGQKVASDVWQTGFKYDHPGMMGSGAYHYTVEQMAFFIDVRRPTGKVVRLWQSRHGVNYSWSDAFSLPTTAKWIAYGNIQYASDASQIFDAKHACGK
jgi:hypothetical protein